MAKPENQEPFGKAVRQGIARDIKSTRSGMPYRLGGPNSPADMREPIPANAPRDLYHLNRILRRGTDKMIKTIVENNRAIRSSQVDRISRQLSRGRELTIKGLPSVANVAGVALDYRDYSAGVKRGEALAEKQAPTEATFAGKPYRGKRGK